jgi:hypothetical protein
MHAPPALASWVAKHTCAVIARMLLVIPLVIAGLLFSAGPSFACSCAYAPTEVGPFADLVFTGVARAYSSDNAVERYVVVDFEVGTIYKGPPATRIQVQAVGGRGPSGGLGAGCEYGFQLGQQYTVFAKDHDSDGVPNTNGCFWNVEGPIDPATYGLASGQAPVRKDETTLLSIVAASAIFALAAISLALRRSATV